MRSPRNKDQDILKKASEEDVEDRIKLYEDIIEFCKSTQNLKDESFGYDFSEVKFKLEEQVGEKNAQERLNNLKVSNPRSCIQFLN